MQKTKGFTLIELLVTMAIFVIALGAVTSFIINSYRSQAFNYQQSTAIDQARRGIETMTKELREARMGDDGSYIIERAEEYEIIFYSDIDKDGDTERVRYFVYESQTLSNENNCVSYSQGGSCNVDFPNFSENSIETAQIEICVEGDLNGGNEYVDIFADGVYLDQLCKSGCNQCLGQWEGCSTFDVTAQAADGSITFTADSSSAVGSGDGGFCDWQQDNHSFKAKFDFSWTETDTNTSIILKKGVIQPTSHPIEYLPESEEITILSQYVRNQLPVFRYFDGNGVELEAPARLENTKMIRTHLIININPERVPSDFELESNVQIRNLKTNL